MKKTILTVLIMLAIATIPTLAAHAQVPLPPTPPDLSALVQAALGIFVGLVGWPNALSVALALLMKIWPAFTAETAGWVSFVANAAMFIVVAYLVFTGQMPVVGSIDSAFGGLAKLLADILIILGSFGVALHTTAASTRKVAEAFGHFEASYAMFYPGKKK
jgi:hypothetical protein